MEQLINVQYMDFLNRIRSGEKIDCPCCGRYAQMYKRNIHHTVAKKLIDLYDMGGDKEYVHTSRLVVRGETSIGDFSKSKYWKLIEEEQSDCSSKRTSGNWKLTEKGRQFVLRQITIPRTVIIFDDQVFGFSEDMVDIQECLESGGFNYFDLIKGSIT